jgi:hypothetical protein
MGLEDTQQARAFSGYPEWPLWKGSKRLMTDIMDWELDLEAWIQEKHQGSRPKENR